MESALFASSLTTSLQLLDETALANLPEQKRPVYVHEWLRGLDRRLRSQQGSLNRQDVREKQKQLVSCLMDLVTQKQGSSLSLGPPARTLAAK